MNSLLATFALLTLFCPEEKGVVQLTHHVYREFSKYFAEQLLLCSLTLRKELHCYSLRSSWLQGAEEDAENVPS